MSLFSEAAKSHSRLQRPIAEIESWIDDLSTLKKQRVEGAGLWPHKRMALNVDVYMQVGIRRIAELVEAVARDVNAEAFAPVWVQARAVMEVAALLWDLSARVRAAVTAPSRQAFQDLDTHLYKLTVGIKSPEWSYSEDVTGKNILTTIERVSTKSTRTYREVLERIASTVPNFMAAYELVSEGAHPNYIGMMESYRWPDLQTGDSELLDRPAKEDPERIVIPVDFAALSVKLALDGVRGWSELREPFISLLDEHQPPPPPEPTPKAWPK